MYLNELKIDKDGIYYTTNEYHNEVATHYVVNFNLPTTDDELKRFIQEVKSIGAQERTKQIGALLGVTK